MTDVLLCWRDYRQNWVRQFAGERAYYWHSNAKLLGELLPGDRLWFITSAKNLRQEAEQAGFLVAVWPVQEVMQNPGDHPREAGAGAPADRLPGAGSQATGLYGNDRKMPA